MGPEEYAVRHLLDWKVFCHGQDENVELNHFALACGVKVSGLRMSGLDAGVAALMDVLLGRRSWKEFLLG